ncbi:MAG: hypothetical protein PHT07_11680 [Paludibacter sp.]|nr:hypothetical protein [Paludibacter sp.]
MSAKAGPEVVGGRDAKDWENNQLQANDFNTNCFHRANKLQLKRTDSPAQKSAI